MTDDAFLELVDKGVATLRPEIRDRLENVAIIIADEPSPEQRAEVGLGPDDVVFGMYEGVPLSERGLEEGFRMPDKITIFKLPILAAHDSPDDIAACVENTVWHELAHHFGWDEAWVAAEEERRGKTL